MYEVDDTPCSMWFWYIFCLFFSLFGLCLLRFFWRGGVVWLFEGRSVIFVEDSSVMFPLSQWNFMVSTVSLRSDVGEKGARRTTAEWSSQSPQQDKRGARECRSQSWAWSPGPQWTRRPEKKAAGDETERKRRGKAKARTSRTEVEHLLLLGNRGMGRGGVNSF